MSAAQIVIPNVLSEATLAELNHVYEERHPALKPGELAETGLCTDRHGNAYRGQRFWSEAYRSLVDNATMVPIIAELLGEPRWGHAHPNLPEELRSRFRLDHHNVHYRDALSPERPARRALGRHSRASLTTGEGYRILSYRRELPHLR